MLEGCYIIETENMAVFFAQCGPHKLGGGLILGFVAFTKAVFVVSTVEYGTSVLMVAAVAMKKGVQVKGTYQALPNGFLVNTNRIRFAVPCSEEFIDMHMPKGDGDEDR